MYSCFRPSSYLFPLILSIHCSAGMNALPFLTTNTQNYTLDMVMVAHVLACLHMCSSILLIEYTPTKQLLCSAGDLFILTDGTKDATSEWIFGHFLNKGNCVPPHPFTPPSSPFTPLKSPTDCTFENMPLPCVPASDACWYQTKARFFPSQIQLTRPIYCTSTWLDSPLVW